jgi:hypothetical protein
VSTNLTAQAGPFASSHHDNRALQKLVLVRSSTRLRITARLGAAISLIVAMLALLCGLSFAQYPQTPAPARLEPGETPVIQTGIFRGMPVVYQIINGRPIFQGDIILDHEQQKLLAQPAQQTVQPLASFGIAYGQYLWTKVSGVAQVPYIITAPAPTDLNGAITAFNSDLSGVIQFVGRGKQANYVNFDFNPNDQSGACEANEGMAGGEQVVGGSIDCNLVTIPSRDGAHGWAMA